MSHIAELVKNQAFQAQKPPKAAFKLLRNRAFLGAAAFVVAAGIGLALRHAGADTPPPANAPVPVTVAAVEARPVRLWSEFSGRMVAVDSADVRPQVDGRITEIRFKDGQTVHAGDILFVIDPRTYEAAAAKAEADLVTAQTNAQLAKTELGEATNLIKAQCRREGLLRPEEQRERHGAGGDQIRAGGADAGEAQCRLCVCEGADHGPRRPRRNPDRQSRADADGSVAAADHPSSRTTASMPISTWTSRPISRTSATHAKTTDQESRIPVELTVQGDNGHVYKGTIESFDNKINTGTGTIRARARFANEDGSLIPGMFVSVKLASAADSKVILVPEDAIGNDQSKRFVFVVGRDHKASFREVALGGEVGGDRVVTSGLHPGEHIIVDGLQKVQPGARRQRALRQVRRALRLRYIFEKAIGRTRHESVQILHRPADLRRRDLHRHLPRGLIAMTQLPISEYPEVVPPSVVVRAQFPGANPKVIAETVATPLEEQINGVENMLYMFSQAASDGTLTLTVTFKLGTDPDLAQQLVQNRVNQALPRLPQVTQRARRHHDEELARPDHGRAPDLAGRPLRHALSAQLRGAERQGSSGEARRASATCSCSAPATTPCASGSIRRRSPSAT